jgi:hypothetical protein
MKKESVMKFVKAGAGVLACAGIIVSPENQNEMVAGFIAIYSLLSGIQGKFKKDDGK